MFFTFYEYFFSVPVDSVTSKKSYNFVKKILYILLYQMENRSSGNNPPCSCNTRQECLVIWVQRLRMGKNTNVSTFLFDKSMSSIIYIT